MKSEKEVRDLMEELYALTGFIGDNGTDEEFRDPYNTFACDVADGLSWVIDEMSTEAFRGDSYLNMDNLKRIAMNIEERTGKKLKYYK